MEKMIPNSQMKSNDEGKSAFSFSSTILASLFVAIMTFWTLWCRMCRIVKDGCKPADGLGTKESKKSVK